MGITLIKVIHISVTRYRNIVVTFESQYSDLLKTVEPDRLSIMVSVGVENETMEPSS
jgi:hypothetical protein